MSRLTLRVALQCSCVQVGPATRLRIRTSSLQSGETRRRALLGRSLLQQSPRSKHRPPLVSPQVRRPSRTPAHSRAAKTVRASGRQSAPRCGVLRTCCSGAGCAAATTSVGVAMVMHVHADNKLCRALIDASMSRDVIRKVTRSRTRYNAQAACWPCTLVPAENCASAHQASVRQT